MLVQAVLMTSKKFTGIHSYLLVSIEFCLRSLKSASILEENPALLK